MDIYILSEDITSRLYKNMNVYTSTNNWIQLKLIGTISNRNAIGARVELITNDHHQIQEIQEHIQCYFFQKKHQYCN